MYRLRLGPILADAQSAPLREHRPRRYARVCPARPSCPGWHTPRRGGLRTPVNEALLLPVDRPSRPPAYHQRTGANDMPRLAYDLATRTHGVRPSEKIAFGVVFGLSALGDAHCDWPPPGGAGSARPQMRLRLQRGTAPLGHQAFARRSVIMLRLGLRPARICGRAECVPPKNHP
jgi:hypothetical protein